MRELFDGKYSVTDDGKLFSNRSNKFLKPSCDKYGYIYYTISIDSARKTVKAHRLVATAFIPNPDNKPTVNHKNGIRNDNRVCNLEWATYKEQANDPLTSEKVKKILNERNKTLGERRNYGRKKCIVDYNGNKFFFDSLKEACVAFSLNESKASSVANGHRKSTGGCKVCYMNLH